MIKTLRIQLTEECNFNCVYCCHEGTKNEFSILKNRNLEAFIRAAYDVLGIKRVNSLVVSLWNTMRICASLSAT